MPLKRKFETSTWDTEVYKNHRNRKRLNLGIAKIRLRSARGCARSRVRSARSRLKLEDGIATVHGSSVNDGDVFHGGSSYWEQSLWCHWRPKHKNVVPWNRITNTKSLKKELDSLQHINTLWPANKGNDQIKTFVSEQNLVPNLLENGTERIF